MPQIYLCFVWHMHQPFYKDLVSQEYKLPWTRMHGLKDYYGMVKVLEDFPQVRQTFNLVPSMMVQVEEYAAGKASDPFLRRALQPAEMLSEEDHAFILQYFFQANPSRLIYRYPRYGELFDAWLAADKNVRRAKRFFGAQELRDLQVLSQLAWFDEEFQDHDEEVRGLLKKGRGFALEDQSRMGVKQLEILAQVLPVYKTFAASGQIEVSMTPFYHPILPLLCDTQIAEVSHPFVPLPPRFRYPDDARLQIDRARSYMQSQFGELPAGLWPSEGSVSDEALTIAAEMGFRWFATDNGVLARTLGHAAGVDETYRPYVWRQNGHELKCIFRDHLLSDLIGFVYSRMDSRQAASHFLDRIRENCDGFLRRGEDALVPIVLDGENAWEYYEKNGRPFLRDLYRQIAEDPRIEALTVSEALAKIEPRPLTKVVPGSWINANFDVWIGAEEDNRAWEYLLRARQTYDRVVGGPEGALLLEHQKQLAFEELLIAEGSDWNWWYGPEHDSANRPEFDQLYRAHLANVYRSLNLPPPDELSRPILRMAGGEYHEPPSGPVLPVIDGDVTSYFEWMGAGVYRVDARSGAMHGHRFLIRELHYGCDGKHLYVRLDLEAGAVTGHAGLEARFSLSGHRQYQECVIIGEGLTAATGNGNQFAYRRVLEGKLTLAPLGLAAGESFRFQLSLWQDGLPMAALPQQGWIEISTLEAGGWQG
ncbi:MAG: glycoside hydrolase family 57 protein [Bryobacteraceae bacterium]|nr:glycoside hydrolase family 57 protein [Bryobacteraceae bacterium]